MNAPEDMVLEEMVQQYWRRKHPQDVESLPIRKIIPQSDLAFHERQDRNKPFAFRPDDPRFYQKAVKSIQDPSSIYEDVPVVEDSRFFGQKEDIDFVDSSPTLSAVFKMDSHKNDADIKHGKLSERINETLTTRAGEPIAHAMTSQHGGNREDNSFADLYFTALIAGCTAAAVVALLAFGVCIYRWQRTAKSAQDVEYPAYGITGPGPSPISKGPLKTPSPSTWLKSPKLAANGDKKLAHSAHMFHFQHQKQQVIAMESHSACDRGGSNSGGESDDDNEEGDYTVYECPGLAPTGEMEVKNPLFPDDSTPATPGNKGPH
nr:EOG090X0B4J [Cyclestheria hislopi]